ncbi:uncharacterized protein LOC144201145 [Stigmatopora nigra]
MHQNKSMRVIFFQLTLALILACLLAQKADSYRLKKSDRRKYTPEGFRRGKIVFGEVLHGDPPLVEDNPKKANVSVQDEAAYQADSAGEWGANPMPVLPPTSQEAAWRRLTSLHCGDHHMKLSVKSPWLSQMTVQQAPNGPQLPLPHVPLNCGYMVHRNSFGFLIYVPYGGCYMHQQAGSYVLPMHWQGMPILLMCNKHSPTDPLKNGPPANPGVTKGPDMGQVPKVPLVPRGPASPMSIWSPNAPHGQSQPPSRPRSHFPHPLPHVPKWPLVPNWPHVAHPGLQKPPLPRDPMYPYNMPSPQNPYLPSYPVMPHMPHMPYVHNMPRPYPASNGMSHYPFYNPNLWQYPEFKPRSVNSKPSNSKLATLLKLPQVPQTTMPPVVTTVPAQTTTAAPVPVTDTTTMLPYNPLLPYPPELMHYISYEDLLAAMYANQQK